MNYTEMEAKVREATNNEPWGMYCLLRKWQQLTVFRGLFDHAAGDRQRDVQLVCPASDMTILRLTALVNCSTRLCP
jgi:hypothetical protein